MGFGFVVEPGHQRIDRGVGVDFGGIEVQLVTPDQAGVLTQIDDPLEEALEDVHSKSLPDAGQAGVVR